MFTPSLNHQSTLHHRQLQIPLIVGTITSQYFFNITCYTNLYKTNATGDRSIDLDNNKEMCYEKEGIS